MLKKLILISLVLSFVSVISSAEVPHTISYQGVLTDASDNPLNGQYTLTFKFYDAMENGNELWSETHENVNVESGVFNVILGSTNSFGLGFNSQYFLGITVGDGEELTPRNPLTSSPYSLNDGDWLSDSNYIFTTDLDSVGIGTSNPKEKLEIAGSNHGIALTDKDDNYNYRIGLLDFDNYGGILNLYDDSERIKAKIRAYALEGVQAYFTAGNVGIGRTDPVAPLEIKGDSSNTSGWTFRVADNDDMTTLGAYNDGKVVLGTNLTMGKFSVVGSENMENVLSLTSSDMTPLLTVENAGFVGVGTSTPSYKLHVNGNAFIQNTARVWGNSILNDAVGIGTDPIGGSTMLNIEAQNQEETKIRILNTYEIWEFEQYGKSTIEIANALVSWYTGVNEFGKFYIGKASGNAVTIKSNYYVGIGEDDPTSRLDVDGTIKSTALSVNNAIDCNTLSTTGNISTISPSEPNHAATKAYVDAVAGSREEIDEIFELIEELRTENQALKARIEKLEKE